MKPVCFDLRGAQPGYKNHFGRGLGRLTACLARHLPEAAPDLEFVGLIDGRLPPPAEDCLPGSRRLSPKVPWPAQPKIDRLLTQELALPLALSGSRRPGLVHYIAHLDAPAWTRLSTVITVNDLIMERQAGKLAGGGPLRGFLRNLEAKACRRAAVIIAVSEHTAKEAREWLGISADRIRVIHEAADPIFKPIRDPDLLADARARFDLPDRYFLTTGGFDPRKNLVRLIKAFGRLIDQKQDQDSVLALAGSLNRDKETSPVKAAVERLGLEKRVRFLGFVADETLPVLYSAATALVFPSLYEGFGLPVLEAMACGCPALLARATSLPEVGGRAALYFDPENTADLVRAMAAVLEGEDLAARLRRDGLERAARFSWRRTAEKTARIYRQVLTGNDL